MTVEECDGRLWEIAEVQFYETLKGGKLDEQILNWFLIVINGNMW